MADSVTITVPVSVTFRLHGTAEITIDLPPRPDVPPFIVGETYPSETTVGAGIVDDYPWIDVNEFTVFEGTPRLVENTRFNDFVQIRSDGWRFRNCAFRGPAAYTSGQNIVWVDPNRVTPAGRPVFEYCDINPQKADPHYNGIGWKLYRLDQCHVWGATDCLAAFARSDDPDKAVHITVNGSWLEKLSQFKPDTAGNRDCTHNDLIQLQGNKGPDDDVLLDGCRLDAYGSQEQSNPTPPTHTSFAAIMITPNQQDRACITVRRSWLTGGNYTINGAATSNSLSVLVAENNRFEKPRSGGPAASIALSPVWTNARLSGNVYPDGTTVPVHKA